MATVDLLIRVFAGQYFDDVGKPIDVDVATDFQQRAKPRSGFAKKFCKLSVCGVDCGDGEMEMALWAAVDEFHRLDGGRFAGRAIPCYGDEAQSRLLRYYDLKPGEWRRKKRVGGGFDWIENPARCKNVAKNYVNVYASFLFDANTSKTRRDGAWRTPADRPGAATICQVENATELEMFATQQTSEEYVETEKSGLVYRRWRMKKPRVADNEFLDTDAGCRALAEYVGCDANSEEKRRRVRTPSLSASEAAARFAARLR